MKLDLVDPRGWRPTEFLTIYGFRPQVIATGGSKAGLRCETDEVLADDHVAGLDLQSFEHSGDSSPVEGVDTGTKIDAPHAGGIGIMDFADFREHLLVCAHLCNLLTSADRDFP